MTMNILESFAIRCLDVLISGLALILLSPLLLPVTLVLALTGEHKIFYCQERVGLNAVRFKLIKFATMLENSPKMGSGDITILNDPRVLPVGRYLRKSKINELPQLLNVLIGDMSMVGPRPMTPTTFFRYGDSCSAIASVRPGLTGVGSIIFRNEERFLASKTDPRKYYFEVIGPYKEKLELWYLKHKSLGLYLLLIVITVFVVFSPHFTRHERWLKGLPARPSELG